MVSAAMRVLIATESFPPRCGGSGWSSFYLARALLARGHTVQVIQPVQGRRGVGTREYEGVTVVEWGYAAWNVPGLRAWQRASALDKSLAAYLAGRARGVDLIHAQHLLTIPPAVAAGRAAGRPVVSTVRDYWPVCLYGTLWREDRVCPICAASERTRCLEQRYGAAARLARPFLPLVDRELARRQAALRDSNAVIAVSRYVAGTLQGSVPAERIHVIPNLVDLEATRRLATGARVESGEEYILFVGKLTRQKGAHLLPDILRRAGTNLKLIVAGDGELKASLAREPGIDVRGWLSNTATLGLLARAQALLFPSVWAEPLARTLLEAQAVGAPTVALDTGGTRDIITHEVNGLLACDVGEFAAQLARLLRDGLLRQRLALAARRTAEAQFSAPVVAAQFERLYASVI